VTPNARMIAESWGLLLLFAVLAVATPYAWPLFVVLQGCWFHRLYTAGHEAAHRKLAPNHPRINDLVGQLSLLPLLVPLRVYRKIHAYHHGWNRRDAHTSALETWVFTEATPARRALAWISWLASVFLGGWFVHGLASMLILVVLPPPVARRIHVAFRGWTWRDQLEAIAVFGTGALLHALIAVLAGTAAWTRAFGLPLLVFSVVYSSLVYIYHYRTGYGPSTRSHARSLAVHPIFSWWLLNFNEHATHHRDPTIPWHALPAARAAHGDRVEPRGVLSAIVAQLAGPVIVERRDVGQPEPSGDRP
jgi:fatty acid desaturase